ncbi:MAG TPA: DASS family sodium-coupled anion symporter [Nitrospiria bacterium]|nr:DASS family sodium-coupled anion symporter [Nitrospiria bacterium]
MALFWSWVLRRRWIFVSFAAGAVLLSLPTPPGLSIMGMRTLSLVVSAFILFLTEAVPLPAVALLIAIFEVLLGIAEPGAVAQSFMSDSVFFIMGSLMLAAALVKQNLDKRIALAILRFTGPRVENIVIGMVGISALIASIIGEHTVAAMMLPVGVTLISFSDNDRRKVKNLGILIMLSIAYGAMIAGIGTPSGGARNAIMLAYWKQLFGIHVSYFRWMEYAYPMVIIQVPLVASLLYRTFRPEIVDLSPAVAVLREKVREQGRMSKKEWGSIGIFFLTVVMWMTISDWIGLGITSLIGISLFIIAGITRWEEINNGVNWGVILIYGGTISMGIAMKNTGAAHWLAESLLQFLQPLGINGGLLLLLAISLITTAITSVITTGATVGILGPIVLDMAKLSGTSIVTVGMVTAISSAFSYMTVFSSPAGNIIYGSGFIKQVDFLKAGWKMVMISVAVVLILASTYWKLLG